MIRMSIWFPFNENDTLCRGISLWRTSGRSGRYAANRRLPCWEGTTGPVNKHPLSESRAASPSLLSPVHGVPSLKTSWLVCNCARFLTRSLSVPLSSFSGLFSRSPSSTHSIQAQTLPTLLPSPCSPAPSSRALTKQLLDDIFRGSPPPIFFPPCSTNKHFTPLLEEGNSIGSLITASSGMHSSGRWPSSCLFCPLCRQTTRWRPDQGSVVPGLKTIQRHLGWICISLLGWRSSWLVRNCRSGLNMN